MCATNMRVTEQHCEHACGWINALNAAAAVAALWSPDNREEQ